MWCKCYLVTFDNAFVIRWIDEENEKSYLCNPKEYRNIINGVEDIEPIFRGSVKQYRKWEPITI